MKWIHHDPAQRIADLASLLNLVSLKSLPQKFLIDVVSKDKLYFKSPEALEAFFDAIHSNIEENIVVFGGFVSKTNKPTSKSVVTYSEIDKKWIQEENILSKNVNLEKLKIVKFGFSHDILDTCSKCFIDFSEISEHVTNHEVRFCTTKNMVYCSGGFQNPNYENTRKYARSVSFNRFFFKRFFL